MNIFEARQLNYDTHLLSNNIYSLLEQLSQEKILLKRNKALSIISNAIFIDNLNDEYQEFDSSEDYLPELIPLIDNSSSFTQLSINNEQYYSIQPFLNKTNNKYYNWLKNHNLSGYSALEDYSNLNNKVNNIENVGELFSNDETNILINHYSESIKLNITTIRNVKTALRYISAGIEHLSKDYTLENPEKTLNIIKQINFLCDLEILPAPAKFFGSESPKINTISTIPDNLNTLIKKKLKH